MKRSTLLLAAPMLAAAVLALFAKSGRIAAAQPPEPDLTGNWLGTFVSDADPRTVGEAAMRIDSQRGAHFTGRLALGRETWEIAGAVDAFNKLHIVGIDPPDPDADPPGGIIFVRGTVRFIDPPEPDADPPGGIVADYLIIGPDGSMEFGSLNLTKITVR